MKEDILIKMQYSEENRGLRHISEALQVISLSQARW